MQLDLTLAGFTSPWSFRGSRTFANWAEDRPWAREGALCVLRTEDAEIGSLIRQSIARFMHGINAGLSRLDIRNIDCGGAHGTPVQAMIRDFELDATISAFEALGRIEARLRDRQLLLVFQETSFVHPDDWLQLVLLLEHVRKAGKSMALAAIVIDHRGVVDVEPICDFRSGFSTHSVLAEASANSNVEALWSAYVHRRVAWEAGGSAVYAMSLGNQVANCAPGDDEEFERQLQQHAMTRLQSHPSKVDLEELYDCIRATDSLTSARRAILEARLFENHLLWRPPALNGLHIVPWASRSILANSALPRKYVWEMRHQLVCAPLAGEILSLCLKFESQILVGLHGRRGPQTVSYETLTSHTRFKQGEDLFVVYPAAFPARPVEPDDAWAFASLGENLRSSTSRRRSNDDNTRFLRNAIAHGHYVNWRHVDWAFKLLQSFDR